VCLALRRRVSQAPSEGLAGRATGRFRSGLPVLTRLAFPGRRHVRLGRGRGADTGRVAPGAARWNHRDLGRPSLDRRALPPAPVHAQPGDPLDRGGLGASGPLSPGFAAPHTCADDEGPVSWSRDSPHETRLRCRPEGAAPDPSIGRVPPGRVRPGGPRSVGADPEQGRAVLDEALSGGRAH
jgi:hypothetical protein